MNLMSWAIRAVESGWVPDRLTRYAIRQLCRQRLNSFRQAGESPTAAERTFRDTLATGPIAMVPDVANRQHYEIPAEFFALMLGPRRKYSCCYFERPDSSLEEAESAALERSTINAELADGQEILELGCGWGSWSLHMAELFPNSQITAVSNSKSQGDFIRSQARQQELNNLTVLTADLNDFVPDHDRYDRIVSIEMFEHMRNYQKLLARIASWLIDGGKLFVHIFCHRQHSYPFETAGAADWMGRYFFTGGIMPSADLLSQFKDNMRVSKQHVWNGQHYQRTADAWLKNLDARRDEITAVLRPVYGDDQVQRWVQRWRLFLLAVSELFQFNQGEEWFVSHYLMTRTADLRFPTPTLQTVGDPA